MEVLIKSGSERVVDDARDHLFRIRTLTDFTYHDEKSDKGHGGAWARAGRGGTSAVSACGVAVCVWLAVCVLAVMVRWCGCVCALCGVVRVHV